MLGKANAERTFASRQDGTTLTVTVKREEDTVLTGTTQILQKLLEQKVQILEFVTPFGTARVDIRAMLKQMGENGSFELRVTEQGASLRINGKQHNELLLA